MGQNSELRAVFGVGGGGGGGGSLRIMSSWLNI